MGRDQNLFGYGGGIGRGFSKGGPRGSLVRPLDGEIAVLDADEEGENDECGGGDYQGGDDCSHDYSGIQDGIVERGTDLIVTEDILSPLATAWTTAMPSMT